MPVRRPKNVPRRIDKEDRTATHRNISPRTNKGTSSDDLSASLEVAATSHFFVWFDGNVKHVISFKINADHPKLFEFE